MARPDSPKTTAHHFLREWRRARGLTQEKLAEAIGYTSGAISQLERGNTSFGKGTLEKLAQALSCEPGDLFKLPEIEYTTLSLLPRDLPSGRIYQIMGYVGGGETVELLGEAPTTGFEEIRLPFDFGPDCAALICRGNSMFPRIKDGEIVIYKRDGLVPEQLIGQEAIVGLDDGRVFLKVIARGSQPNRWTLESHNFPSIYDATVEWCSEALAIVKPGTVL